MLLECLLISSIIATVEPPTVSAPIVTTARFVEEFDHADLSYLQTTPVAIMGDSISSWKGVSIEGGSEAVYPDSTVTDLSQMWFANLNYQEVSSVSGSYVHHREDGEYVNFNSDTRIGAIGDTGTVIIYGGTCDLLADVSVSDFEVSLRSLVLNVQYGDKRSTVLCTLPPIDHKNSDGDDYKDFNKVIRKVATETGSALCEFEDAWAFSDIDQYTEDGVHPNVQGMSRLAERFR